MPFVKRNIVGGKITATFANLQPGITEEWLDDDAAELSPVVVDIKDVVWQAIKVERNRRKTRGFKVNVDGVNKWFHSDSDSRIQHLGLKDRARDMLATGAVMTDKITVQGLDMEWKTMDGSFVDVSVQVAFDIVSAVGDFDAQLFAVAERHKALMKDSVDPGSYDYSGGWPLSFGE